MDRSVNAIWWHRPLWSTALDPAIHILAPFPLSLCSRTSSLANWYSEPVVSRIINAHSRRANIHHFCRASTVSIYNANETRVVWETQTGVQLNGSWVVRVEPLLLSPYNFWPSGARGGGDISRVKSLTVKVIGKQMWKSRRSSRPRIFCSLL